MPMMSDNRRRRIVSRQLKLENARKRAAKAAKRERKPAQKRAQQPPNKRGCNLRAAR